MRSQSIHRLMTAKPHAEPAEGGYLPEVSSERGLQSKY